MWYACRATESPQAAQIRNPPGLIDNPAPTESSNGRNGIGREVGADVMNEMRGVGGVDGVDGVDGRYRMTDGPYPRGELTPG